jgi:beta-galactosidase
VARQKPDSTAISNKLAHPPFTFRVPAFSPGTLKARAWLAGKPVAEHSITTPDTPARLELRPALNGRGLSGEGDLLFLYAHVVDKNGTTVPDATPLVTFESSDAVELIGDNPARAEAGVASILMRVRKPSPTVTLKASTPQLPEATLSLP